MVDEGLLAEAARLSPSDRLDLIGALWDSLAHDQLPVTGNERRMLDELRVDLATDPGSSRPWAEIERELRLRLP